jgi:positive regulator of sigma E activity
MEVINTSLKDELQKLVLFSFVLGLLLVLIIFEVLVGTKFSIAMIGLCLLIFGFAVRVQYKRCIELTDQKI